MKVLDLFCGMGGWSVGFHREGFKCYGLDNVDVGYPYELIQRDIREFSLASGWHYKNGSPVIDVIVAGPPCTEFSHLTKLSWKKGQRGPPDPAKGMELVKETQRLIQEASPIFWAVENVQGALEYFEPLWGPPKLNARPWYLWGNFPTPKLPDGQYLKGVHRETKRGNALGLPEDFPFDPLRSWRRARLPVFLSQAIARECKSALTLLGRV
jgi:hypothetical protein